MNEHLHTTNKLHPFFIPPFFSTPQHRPKLQYIDNPCKAPKIFFYRKKSYLIPLCYPASCEMFVTFIHPTACLTSTLHTLFYEILISILRSNNDQMTFKLSQPSSGNALGDSVPLLYNREPFPPSRLEVLASIEIASSASPTSCRHVVSNSSTVSRNRKTANLRAWRGGRSAPVLCTGKS